MQLLGTLAFFPEQMTVEPRRPARLIMECADVHDSNGQGRGLVRTSMSASSSVDGDDGLRPGRITKSIFGHSTAHHHVGSSRRTGSGLELVSDPLSVHEGGAASRFRSGFARRGG